jgi:tetratricopeptide (TPR) repeat protein
MSVGNLPDPDYLLDAAQKALSGGDWTRAEAMALQCVAARPDDAYAWYILGNARSMGRATDDARHAFRRAIELDPDLPDAHCGLADLYLQRGEDRRGLDLFVDVLRRWPDFAPAAMMLGHALRARGDPAGAGAAFVWASRAWPELPEAIEQVLDSAATLVERGRDAPVQPPSVREPVPLISFVVCSITPAKLESARASLAASLAGADWELVHVPDAVSLCEGYNRGLAQSRGALVVFCHDDIEVLVGQLHLRLAQALREYDVVGVAGCSLLKGPSWVWTGAPHAHGFIAHAVADGRISCRAYSLAGPGIGSIQALDGVFIACRREAAEALRFDDVTFDHFHLYDTDFSYRAHRAGCRVGVDTGLRLLHYSGGRDTGGHWRTQAERFLAKHRLPPPGPAEPLAGADVIVPDAATAVRVFAWLEHWQSQAPGQTKGPANKGARVI